MLLDAKPPKPPRKLGKPIAIGLIILIVGGLLFYRFRNFTEERAVRTFLNTLEQGHYQRAYKLWQPSGTYKFSDFMHGWGPEGDYGKIRSYEILSTKSKGSETVIVTVKINGVEPPLDLLVDRKTKGLAYSIF
jgi:hypothetical protein